MAQTSGPRIPTSLQPTTAVTTKPPTVAERRIIKKYGSLEAARQVQAQQVATSEQKIMQEKVDQVSKDIEAGKITSLNQIDKSLLQYFDQKGLKQYFVERAAYQARTAREAWFQQQLKDLKSKYEGQQQDSVRRQMTPEEAAIYVGAASQIQHADFSQKIGYTAEGKSFLAPSGVTRTVADVRASQGLPPLNLQLGVAKETVAPTMPAGSPMPSKVIKPELEITRETVAPTYLDPVRSMDLVTGTGKGAGAITVYGATVPSAIEPKRIKPEDVVKIQEISLRERKVAPPLVVEEAPALYRFKEDVKGKFGKGTANTWMALTSLSTATAMTEEKAQSSYATMGAWDFSDDSRVPPGATGVVEQIKFPTDKELEGMSFGGYDELVRRQEAKLGVVVSNIVGDAQAQIDPKYDALSQQIVDELITEFQTKVDAGKLTVEDAQSQMDARLDKRFNELEKQYKKEIEQIASPSITTSTQEVQQYLDTVAKSQRRRRALVLAAPRFAESFVLGAGFGGLFGAAAAVAPRATRVGGAILGAGLLTKTAMASQAIATSFTEDPIAFALEIVPPVAGFVLGANPQLIEKAARLGKKFTTSQKQLFQSKKAMAKTKTKQKTKQVQTKKRDSEADRKKLKEALEEANEEELKAIIRKGEKAIKNADVPESVKVEMRQKFAATVIEARTGVSIIDEFGNVNMNQLRSAMAGRTPLEPVAEPPLAGRIPVMGELGVLGTGVSSFIEEGTIAGALGREAIGLRARAEVKVKEEEVTLSLISGKLAQRQKVETAQAQPQAFLLSSALAQPTATATTTALSTRTALSTAPSMVAPSMTRAVARPRPKPKPVITGGFGFIFPSEKEAYAKYQGVGYNVEGKQTKTGKWLKLNTKPMTYSGAKSLGGEAVDKSLSRRFRVKPITKTVKVKGKKKEIVKKFKKPEQLEQGTGYWNMVAERKFRPYKIKKGVKIPLKEEFIEKKQFIGDTRGELQKLKLEKKRAVTTRARFGLPIRRSNPKGLKRKGFFI